MNDEQDVSKHVLRELKDLRDKITRIRVELSGYGPCCRRAQTMASKAMSYSSEYQEP